MFKRFLKFFRGEEDAPVEPFEGSYLDHLLSQMRPDVEALLEETPEHDPLLLVVVGILRLTMLNSWSPHLRTPLYDSQSPGRIPRSVGDTKESSTTDEFEAAGDEESEDPVETLDEVIDLDPDDTTEAPPRKVDESGEVDVDRKPVSRSTRKTEEIDVEEVRAASLRGRVTETAELERVEPTPGGPEPTVEIETDALFGSQETDGRPRVDSEEVLQAGRVFLGLLIENDRLPLELQLTVTETTLARDLLLGYFVGHDDFEEKARRLLTLVEQKFGEGLFSQARILLQLFHTDEQTRINNDRNLFYEDMILRLGIRRRHRMSADDLKRFKVLMKESSSGDGALALTKWMSDTCLIHFHAFNRDPRQVRSWNEVLDKTEREGARENFLRYLPARRWRPLGSLEGMGYVDQVVNHVSMETARDYVISQIKSCYFVLRAVGDTGLEGYLDTFFDWSKETFGLDGTTLMPELYKRSMMDPEPMTTILRDVYDEFYAPRVVDIMNEITDEQIQQAAVEALASMGDVDLGEIAPGYYDIGSFVYDRLFGVEYPNNEFPFKIHRLT